MKIDTPNFHKVPIEPELVAELKSRFLEEAALHPEKYDHRDLTRIERGEAADWLVKRFIHVAQWDYPKLSSEREQLLVTALQHMKSVYYARMVNDVNDVYEMAFSSEASRDESDNRAAVVTLREEFFTTGELIPWGPDDEGRLWAVINCAALTEPIPRLVYHHPAVWFFEALDRLATQRETMVIIIRDLQQSNCFESRDFTANLSAIVNGTLVGHVAANLVLGVPNESKPLWLRHMGETKGEMVRSILSSTPASLKKLITNRKDSPGGRLPAFMKTAKKRRDDVAPFSWRVHPVGGVKPLNEMISEEEAWQAELSEKTLPAELGDAQDDEGKASPFDVKLSEKEIRKYKRKMEESSERLRNMRIGESQDEKMGMVDMLAKQMEEGRLARMKHKRAILSRYVAFKRALLQDVDQQRDIAAIPASTEAYFVHFLN